jgi:hypothetical protein
MTLRPHVIIALGSNRARIRQFLERAAGRCVLSVLILLVCAPAAAEEGPALQYITHTGWAGIAPLGEHAVRLVSLDLHITWGVDADGGAFYRAHAEHQLENTGPEMDVEFAVPLEWNFPAYEQYAKAGKPIPAHMAEWGAKGTRVTFNGRRVSCAARPGHFLGASPHALRSGVTEGACVTSLRVPRGRQVLLTLDVTAYLRDLADGNMQVGYWLAPSGGWAGLTDRVRIVVEVGSYAPLAKVVSPAGAHVSGTSIVWDLRAVSVAKLDAVKIQLPTMGFAEGHGWARTDAQVEVSASGQRLGELSDGDPQTRWCGTAPASLEARVTSFRALPGQRCSVRDLAFSTDWIDAGDWGKDGNSVTGLHISACSEPNEGLELRLANHGRAHIRDTPDHGFLGEAIFPAGVIDGPPGCIRVDVTGVDPRRGGRFCLGELLPRVYCRDESVKRPALKQAQQATQRDLDRSLSQQRARSGGR